MDTGQHTRKAIANGSPSSGADGDRADAGSGGKPARPGVTERVAHYIAETDVASAPPELTPQIQRAIIDLFAATIAARNDPGFRALHRVVAEDMKPGPCTVIATGEKTSASHAALLNGGAGHALDYDDVSDTLYGHPTVALVPPLLAVAEARGLSGRDVVDAYSIGFDVAVGIALALPVWPHFNKGWHATASIGVLSATAALCRLLKLPVEATRNALGIAGSMVGSSRQNFGTMTKPLHPGMSSFNAVMAARLAEQGFTADREHWEKPLGYFAVHGADSDLERLLESLERPHALLRDGLSFKKFPACYNTHRMGDAAIALAKKLGPDLVRKIDSITVTMQPTGSNALIHHRPTTGLQGKFSAEYVVAAGLLDGELMLPSFVDEAVQRPEIQALIRKVEVREAEVPPIGAREWEFAYAVLDVSAGGHLYRERVDIPRGDCRNPLTGDDVDLKFVRAVEFSKSGWDAKALLDEVKAIPMRAKLDGFAHMTT
jgi:2-methylcitrate dehydratase PrpD